MNPLQMLLQSAFRYCYQRQFSCKSQQAALTFASYKRQRRVSS